MIYSHRIRAAFLACLAVATCSTIVDAAVDFQPIQRLRRQGLYRAAERKCLDLLELKLSDPDRAMTLVEYLRTMEAHVATTDASERMKLIELANQKVDAYVRKHPDSPYGFLVAIQFAITKSTNARFARFDAEANLSPNGFTSAIDAGRTAIRDFETLHTEIGEAMREANNRRPRKGFSQVQFQRLRNTVEWETARAWVNLSQCFPDSKKDRISVLAKAVDLTEPLTRLAANPTIATKARLLDAECRRRIGDANRAREILTTMAADRSLSPCVQLAVATQQVWLSIEANQLHAAHRIVVKAKSIRCDERQARAELAYATLNLYVDLAVQTGQQDNDVWRLRADQQTQMIAREFPGYWQRRSDIVFAELRGGSVVASELANIESKAARAFAAKQFDDSVSLYEQAAAIAEEKGLRDRVFQFRYRAGAILHQQQQYASASTQLRRAACEDAAMPEANKAHLLAIVDTAQLVPSGDADTVQLYAELLNEHLANWPDRKTVSQVAWWLGQLRQRQQDYAAANDAYAQIEIDFSAYRQVIDSIRTCHTKLVSKVEDSRQIPDAIGRGVKQLEEVAAALHRNNDTHHRWAILNVIDLELLHPSKTAMAERKLLQIIQDAKEADDGQAVTKGNALLMVVYVAQGRMESAKRVMKQLEKLDARDARDLMRRLDRVNRPRIEKNLGAIQLELFELQNDEPVPDDIRGLYAQSLTQTGKFDTAVAVLQQQLHERPLSIPLRRELATTFQRADKPREALLEWRKLAAGSRPASDEWFLAKYGIAENLLATGSSKEAADVIRVTQALHPSLGGADLKNRFALLLRQCEAK
ncbi:tetratricopeptide repeat protein [Planctomycetota bacterium]